MLLHEDETIVCAWLTVPEFNLSTKKDTLLPSTISLHENKLIAKHSGHPEIQCLRLRIGWQNIKEYHKDELLEARVEGKQGTFNLPGHLRGKNKFQIAKQTKSNSLAFYENQSNDKGTLISQVGKINGLNQIMIEENNTFRSSSNLSGKKIKLKTPIIYPEVLIKRADWKINKLDAVIAVKNKDNQFRAINLLSGDLSFQETVDEEKVIFCDWEKSISYVLGQNDPNNTVGGRKINTF